MTIQTNKIRSVALLTLLIGASACSRAKLTMGDAELAAAQLGLQQIQLSPSAITVPQDVYVKIQAIGLYRDGSVRDVTPYAAFHVTNNEIKTATEEDGSVEAWVKGSTPGTNMVLATFGSHTAQSAITVTTASLQSVTMSPSTFSLARDFKQQLRMFGIYSDGSAVDLTYSASWVSSNPAVASVGNEINVKGKVTALQSGTSTISGSFNGLVSQAAVTATNATLSSLQITPSSISMPMGLTQQYAATGLFSDGTMGDLTDSVTWSSSNTLVATISNSPNMKGVAQGVSQGTTTISGLYGGVSGSTGLTIGAGTLVSISVSAASSSLSSGLTQQYTATGHYSDATTSDITSAVIWTSSNSSVATLSNSGVTRGLASGVAAGTTLVSASLNGISGEVSLTVTSATPTSLAFVPTSLSIAAGVTSTVIANATFSDSSVSDVSSLVTWTTSNSAVATVSNLAGSRGQVTAVGTGSATITGTILGVSNNFSVTVTSATLLSITVTPASPSVAKGLTKQFTATGNYSDASTVDLTSLVTWASTATSVAPVSNAAGSKGLATAAATGTSTISATYSGQTGSTVMTVTAPALLSIVVTPANSTILILLETKQMVATGTYTDLSTANITTSVVWASTNTACATIRNDAGWQGKANGLALGSTTISATSGSISGSTTLSGINLF